MNTKVREYLIDIARQKEKFAYYSDIVKDCGLDIDLKSEYGRANFTKLLSDISEFEDSNRRPLLSSMAIYKDANRNDHGDGFYIVAEKLKKGKFKKLKDDLYGFTEAGECRKFWQNDQNHVQFSKTKNQNSDLNQVARLFESLINAEEYTWAQEWKDIYIDFVNDVKKLQKAVVENPQLSIDNDSLYKNLSNTIQSYEAFMLKWLKENKNGISSRGQSVLSADNFRTIVADEGFKTIAKLVISNPNSNTYQLLVDWWFGNEAITNRPLLINRAVAACLPERLCSTVDNQKFWYVVYILKSKFGFALSENPDWNWFTANLELTKWLDSQLQNVIGKVSNDKLEQQIWRNIFVWLVYEKYQGKPPIASNTLIRRDPPKDGHTELPSSNTNFEGHEVDFERKAKEQKELGDAGEELVKLYEIKKLENLKMLDKAKLVRIAKPGEGFDVYSFDKNGKEKFIEVKTTSGDWKNRFYLTRHEIKFMRKNTSKYSLYRVYNFDEENNSGEYFELTGGIEERLIMDPTQFEVVIMKAP